MCSVLWRTIRRRLQFYDAPHQLNSNVFLTRRAALPLADARPHLEARANSSDPASATRCPLAPARMDGLLDPARREFSKPGAFCRCAPTARCRWDRRCGPAGNPNAG